MVKAFLRTLCSLLVSSSTGSNLQNHRSRDLRGTWQPDHHQHIYGIPSLTSDCLTPPNTRRVARQTHVLIGARAYTLSTKITSIQTKAKNRWGKKPIYGIFINAKEQVIYLQYSPPQIALAVVALEGKKLRCTVLECYGIWRMRTVPEPASACCKSPEITPCCSTFVRFLSCY